MQINMQLEILTAFLSLNGEFTKAEAILDLIRLAVHPEGDDLPNGYILTSVNALAGRWGWSRTKVNSFLQELQYKNFILLKKPEKAGNCRFVIYIQAVQYQQ